MKNSFHFQNRTVLKNTLLMRFLVIAIVFTLSAQLHRLHAQGPKLSIQGILKKANGDAVTDGSYNLTFRLYTTPTGPLSAAVWDEVQTGVDVISGIYSTVLGNDSTLNIAFNQIYYLGVTVGSTEMTPRIQLTSAPYALSLIGATNQFPSSGIVKADSIRVAGGVLARGGTPGANGANKNGFAFTGNNGDKDSGLFSTALGQVSLYVNNANTLTATPDSVAIRKDLRLNNDANINYNGLDDWRLAYVEDFKNGANGWQWYAPTGGEYIGWNNGTAGGAATVTGSATNYAGQYIIPGTTGTDNRRVLKKSYSLADIGNYNFIKIKFKYYVLDTWDDGQDGDRGLAMIAQAATGTQLRVGWTLEEKTWTNYTGDLGAAFSTASNFGGSSNADYSRDAEMEFFKCTTCNDTFWLMFGARLNGNVTDENFGVGMIEIWVK